MEKRSRNTLIIIIIINNNGTHGGIGHSVGLLLLTGSPPNPDKHTIPRSVQDEHVLQPNRNHCELLA